MPARKPLGSKRNHNGYIQVKMVQGQRRWPFEHRVVWEHAHGPIPPGYVIHHLNGDRADNRIANLVLEPSNSEHYRRHHHDALVEICRRVGQAGKGKPKSPAHRAAIAAALRGKPKSPEHRAQIIARIDPITKRFRRRQTP
jgi:hypothetical protein